MPIGVASILVMQSNNTFQSIKAGNKLEYSMTLSDYDGGNEQTYYSSSGNAFTFEFNYCAPYEDGFAQFNESSTIICSDYIHGITSLTITSDDASDESYINFTIFNSMGSFAQMSVTPNQECLIEIESYGFSVSFEGNDFNATGLTFVYTCL